MAGEWIKFDSSLPEKPETLAITAAMGWTDPDLTVGKLMRLFRWFDQQTVDGNAARVTPALLDHVLGVTGLTLAVASVGWITVTDAGLSLSKFDRHNGESAKQRAQTAKRVAKHKGNAKGNGEGNAAGVSSALPREEKRREEISPSIEGDATQRKRSAPHVVGCPADVDSQTWTDWLSLRKAKKAPVTETVLTAARSECLAAGMTLDAFLQVWCMRGSQGLQADWLKPHERQTQSRLTFAQQAADIARTTVPAKQGRDPALARIDADDKRAAPIPDAVRKQLATLKFSGLTQ